jgi:hypothetical protein
VISATLSPMPWPYSAAVVASISRIPGPPLGPSLRMTITLPSRICRASTAANVSSSHSNTCAGPRNCSRFIPATLTIAPSGASEPRKPTTPPVGVIGAFAS